MKVAAMNAAEVRVGGQSDGDGQEDGIGGNEEGGGGGGGRGQ